MSYKELKGKCKFCLGCSLLEDENFNGTDECIWAETPIEQTVDIEALEQMRRIKMLFDPNNILNPGKIFEL